MFRKLFRILKPKTKTYDSTKHMLHIDIRKNSYVLVFTEDSISTVLEQGKLETFGESVVVSLDCLSGPPIFIRVLNN